MEVGFVMFAAVPFTVQTLFNFVDLRAKCPLKYFRARDIPPVNRTFSLNEIPQEARFLDQSASFERIVRANSLQWSMV
jgi:hypothetical protein